MERAMQELTNLIRDLVHEIGDLKERVSRLEGTPSPDSLKQPATAVDIIKLQGEGYENLGRIYAEGYHVCPVAYGEPRQDGCLFCIAFMSKD